MLLDTSGLFCLQYRDEPLHERACELYRKAIKPITHNYILTEYVVLATVRRFPRRVAIEYVADLANSPQIRTIWVDRTLHDEAIALLLARPDKTYSLCDAVSFVLMRRYGVEEALTTDRHFEQEGFLRQLK